MKNDPNLFRIVLITFEAAGDENATEVAIKFEGKSASVKSSKVPERRKRQGHRRSGGRAGDSAL